jgi:hypothetical protein
VRRVTGALGVILLVSSTLSLTAMPAMACNPGRPVYAYGGFSGTQKSVSNVHGVQTRLETYQSFIQGDARAWAWNMLSKPGIPGGQQWWAQVGWSVRTDGQWIYSPSVFTSWTDNVGNYWVKDYNGVESGQTFYTYYLPAGKQFRLFVNSTQYDQVTGGWTPSIVEIYGETHNRNTQMPGDTSNKVRMDNAKTILNGGTTWSSMNSTAGANDPAIYGATKVNATTYDIWDKYCSSPGGN